MVENYADCTFVERDAAVLKEIQLGLLDEDINLFVETSVTKLFWVLAFIPCSAGWFPSIVSPC